MEGEHRPALQAGLQGVQGHGQVRKLRRRCLSGGGPHSHACSAQGISILQDHEC